MKSMKRDNPLNKVRLMMAGIIIVVLNVFLPFFSQAYPYAHSKGEGVGKFAIIELAEGLTDSAFYLDIFLDPIGYLFIILAVYGLFFKEKRFKVTMWSIIVSTVAYGLSVTLPFFVPEDNLFYVLLITRLVLAVAFSAIIFNIIKMLVEQPNVDRYMNMEFEKDLKFAWEINLIAGLAIPILQMMSVLKLFFASLGCTIIYWLNVAAMIYFCFSMYKNIYKLRLFSEK